ncbi:Hypothetical_protein [Hexamita inflata]|uniref:Hypothetical_protein n=1 Tax=Hexamita inflata TaxID=28002 RepID=A0AA86QUP3_9EUKA|nr:Hypothetical protein HINF_LOCUS54034 [Hexamita inflata]
MINSVKKKLKETNSIILLALYAPQYPISDIIRLSVIAFIGRVVLSGTLNKNKNTSSDLQILFLSYYQLQFLLETRIYSANNDLTDFTVIVISLDQIFSAKLTYQYQTEAKQINTYINRKNTVLSRLWSPQQVQNFSIWK